MGTNINTNNSPGLFLVLKIPPKPICVVLQVDYKICNILNWVFSGKLEEIGTELASKLKLSFPMIYEKLFESGR